MGRNAQSISRRLTVWILLGAFAILVAGNVAVGVALHARISAAFDTALLAKAQVLVTLTKFDGEAVELDFADEFIPEFSAGVGPSYFQIWLDGDSILERSRSLGNQDLMAPAPSSDAPVYTNLRLPDGRQGRAVTLAFQPQIPDASVRPGFPDGAPHEAVLAVAQERETLNDSLWKLHVLLAGCTVLLLLGLALIVRTAVKVGLRPLEDVERQVSMIRTATSGTRIEPQVPVIELENVVARFNELLARFEQEFDRQRQFSSNIAHELRTPIAELQTLAEVGRKWPDDPDLVRGFFDDVLSSAHRLQRLVQSLFQLSHGVGSTVQLNAGTLDLSAVLRQALEEAGEDIAAKALSVSVSPDTAVNLWVDEVCFSGVMRNLVDNAVAYAAPGSTVSVEFEVSNNRGRLSIANETRDLQRADLQKMAQPFWRKDAARSGDRHAGLGLAIVSAFSELLGIRGYPHLDDNGRFEYVLDGLAIARE